MFDGAGGEPSTNLGARMVVRSLHTDDVPILGAREVSKPARRALVSALAAVLGLLVTGVLSLGSPLVQGVDNAMAGHLLELRQGALGNVALTVVHVCDRAPYTLLGLFLVAVAIVRGCWLLGCVLPLVLLGSVLTTETLKPIVATQRGAPWLNPQVAAASWPSGHATAALTLALCAVLVTPARLRRAVALLGTVFVCALAWATLVFGGHLPSDLIGGYLVSVLWGLPAASWLVLRGPPAT
jgi:membrane-associated phospholipid phosphatase